MRASLRFPSRGLAAVLALVVGLVLLLIAGPISTRAAAAAGPVCSSYPQPGAVAADGTALPAAIAKHYALFTGRPTGTDAAALRQVAARLPASGLIASGARLIGHEPNQAALYAVPAEHYLPYPLAPARCVPANERSIVSDETKLLKADYAHPAICVFAVGGHEHGATPLTSCAPLTGAPEALLDAAGQPLLGLAPNGVDAVTARYLAAPVKTITVHDNFYAILGDSNQEPCGLEWLDESGNVTRSIEGCNYLGVEEPLLRTYRQQVSGQLAGVQSDVETMAMAIGAGNLAGAQADWLTAHTAWLQIGQDDGAYGAFGSLGGEIDGLSGGLAGGSASPDFTGFHKVELDLWGSRDLTAAGADVATLEQMLAKLIAVPIGSELPISASGVGNWVLRPHEILEDALRDTLTGNDDDGSGTSMASIVADVSADRALLTTLTPLLNELSPGLVTRATGQLDAIDQAADATQVNGAWVALGTIPTLQRERVDAAVGAALETLAPVPDLLTGTGQSAPPS